MASSFPDSISFNTSFVPLKTSIFDDFPNNLSSLKKKPGVVAIKNYEMQEKRLIFLFFVQSLVVKLRKWLIRKVTAMLT